MQMHKRILAAVTVLVVLSSGATLAAVNLVPATVIPSGRPVLVPETAIQVADNVFSLGLTIDPASGRLVEGYAIVHYKQSGAKPSGGPAKGTSQCYGFLAKGAKWKSVEPWVVNPANTRGLAGGFIFSNVTADIAKWEDATDGIAGNALGVNVLGDGLITTSTLVADTVSPDGVNEIYFADTGNPNAIAVTIVWGIFGGPTFARELVEWDQIYNDVDFDWSSSGEAGKMDFENIATHELGHSVGMADLYTLTCSEETMYGYAALGETKKQTLNTGDTTGVNQLY